MTEPSAPAPGTPAGLVTRAEATVHLGCSRTALDMWMAREDGWPEPETYVVQGTHHVALYDLEALRAVRDRLHPRRVRAWREEEDRLLADRGLSAPVLAARLGRSVESVQSRRRTLGLRMLVRPVRDEWLIARTCTRCGRLRWRDEYRVLGRHRHRVSVCLHCMDAALSVRSASAQERTEQTARHAGARWTGAELEIALREDLSVEEVAVMLGRTYHSVVKARYRARRDPAWVAAFKTR